MGNIAGSVGKSARQTAKQIAKTIIKEPLEMGRVARQTIVGVEKPKFSQNQQTSTTEQKKAISPEEKLKIEAKKRRLLQAFERELEDIRKQKKLKEEEAKRQEAVKIQMQEEQKKDELPLSTSKPSRKFGETVKTHIQRLKKSTETRMPPSG